MSSGVFKNGSILILAGSLTLVQLPVAKGEQHPYTPEVCGFQRILSPWEGEELGLPEAVRNQLEAEAEAQALRDDELYGRDGADLPPPDNEPNHVTICDLFGGVGYRRMYLPKLEFGVVDFGKNLDPLFKMPNELDGPVFQGGLTMPLPVKSGDGWIMTITGTVGQLQGDTEQTISSFQPGTLPTYINLSGNSGFGFNENGKVKIDSHRDLYAVDANVIWPVFRNPPVDQFGPNFSIDTAVSAFFGVQVDHSVQKNDFTMETDFRNGTFVNLRDDRIEETRLGAHVGTQVVYPVGDLVMVFDVHAGLAHTRAKFRASECGDGSTGTPGCDGGLYSISGIDANYNGLGFVGGVKATGEKEVLCGKDEAIEAARGKECWKLFVGGEINTFPTVSVDQPTQIGAGQRVSLQGRQAYDLSLFFGFKGTF